MNNYSQNGFYSQPQTRQQTNYISQYNSNGYLSPYSQNMLGKSSQTTSTQLYRDSYHINNDDRSRYQNKIQNASLSSRVKSQSKLISSQVKNEEIVKGESRVNYVPYEKKVIQYQNRSYTQKVPIKRKVVQYKEQRVIQTIPKQVIKQDYYAVETKTHYIKQVIPEKKVQMVPVQKKIIRYEYVPVQKQIIHYPQNMNFQSAKGQSRVILQNQGVNVKPDAQFKPLSPNLLYNYSNRPESRYNPIGYYDQGQSRVFSNTPTSFNPQNVYLQPQNFSNDYGMVRHNSQKRIDDIRLLNSRFQQGQRQIRGQAEYQRVNQAIPQRNIKRPFEILERSNVRLVSQSPRNFINERNINRQQGRYQQRYQQHHD